MSNNDVRELKDYVGQVKEDLLTAINNLRVHLAEDYVSKEEFKDYKKEQQHRTTVAATIGGIIVAAIMGIINLFKGGGN